MLGCQAFTDSQKVRQRKCSRTGGQASAVKSGRRWQHYSHSSDLQPLWLFHAAWRSAVFTLYRAYCAHGVIFGVLPMFRYVRALSGGHRPIAYFLPDGLTLFASSVTVTERFNCTKPNHCLMSETTSPSLSETDTRSGTPSSPQTPSQTTDAAATAPPKIAVRNLYKVFGENTQQAFRLIDQNSTKEEVLKKTGCTLAVSNVSLSVNEGEIFVIMGLSGSGKSTLVRLFNRLIEPSRGQVFIDGEDVVTMSEEELRETRRKKISMVFQSFALMPHLTVLENAAFGLDLAGVAKDEAQERARKALEQVGLVQYLHSYPDECSGGMRQRVGLARALATNPDILLMDEAFSALDPLIRTEMQDELIKLQARDRRTIVFISHDLDEAMRIGDRIAIMRGGEVMQVGTPDDILKNPANDYVESFFHEVNVANVFTAGDIARRTQVTILQKSDETGVRAALKRLKENDRDYGYLLNSDRQLIGVVSAELVRKAVDEGRPLHTALVRDLQAINASTPLSDLMVTVAQYPCPVPVVTDDGCYAGSVSKARLLQTLSKNTSNANL